MEHVIVVRFFGGCSVYGPFQNILAAEKFITENSKGRGVLTAHNWEVQPLRSEVELASV